MSNNLQILSSASLSPATCWRGCLASLLATRVSPLQLSRDLYKSNLFLQNKANSPSVQYDTIALLTRTYKIFYDILIPKNKAKQSQFKPNFSSKLGSFFQYWLCFGTVMKDLEVHRICEDGLEVFIACKLDIFDFLSELFCSVPQVAAQQEQFRTSGCCVADKFYSLNSYLRQKADTQCTFLSQKITESACQKYLLDCRIVDTEILLQDFRTCTYRSLRKLQLADIGLRDINLRSAGISQCECRLGIYFDNAFFDCRGQIFILCESAGTVDCAQIEHNSGCVEQAGAAERLRRSAADSLDFDIAPVKNDRFDSAGNGPASFFDSCPFEGGPGGTARGDELIFVAQHDFAVGPDIDEHSNFVAVFDIGSERCGCNVGSDEAGDVGDCVDIRFGIYIQFHLCRGQVLSIKFVGFERNFAQCIDRVIEEQMVHCGIAGDGSFEDCGWAACGFVAELVDEVIYAADDEVMQLSNFSGGFCIIDSRDDVVALDRLRVRVGCCCEPDAGFKVDKFCDYCCGADIDCQAENGPVGKGGVFFVYVERGFLFCFDAGGEDFLLVEAVVRRDGDCEVGIDFVLAGEGLGIVVEFYFAFFADPEPAAEAVENDTCTACSFEDCCTGVYRDCYVVGFKSYVEVSHRKGKNLKFKMQNYS